MSLRSILSTTGLRRRIGCYTIRYRGVADDPRTHKSSFLWTFHGAQLTWQALDVAQERRTILKIFVLTIFYEQARKLHICLRGTVARAGEDAAAAMAGAVLHANKTNAYHELWKGYT